MLTQEHCLLLWTTTFTSALWLRLYPLPLFMPSTCVMLIYLCLCLVCVCRRGTGMPTRSTCLKQWSSWGSSMPGGSWRSVQPWVKIYSRSDETWEEVWPPPRRAAASDGWPKLISCQIFINILRPVSSRPHVQTHRKHVSTPLNMGLC